MSDPLPYRLARRLAAFGLGPDGGARFEVPEESWRGLVGHLTNQRLTGLALAAASAGTLCVPAGRHEELLELHLGTMLWALTLERRLLALTSAFEEAGIEALVLKGPALAHTCYPDASWRPFGDVDLLVRTRDWREACSLLPELGYRRRMPEPRPGFSERFGNAAAHVSADGVEVDLHRSLVIGPFGLWMEPEELFEPEATFEMGGRRIRRLDDTALLLHACVHASLGFSPPLLLPVRDVAQITSQADVDWELFADQARRWRLGVVVQHAFSTATEVLGPVLPEEAALLAGARPTRRERRALRAYVTPVRWRGGTTVFTLLAIPGIRSKAAYLRALLFPSRDFLANRTAGGKRPSYLRRWLAPLRWLRRASPEPRSFRPPRCHEQPASTITQERSELRGAKR